MSYKVYFEELLDGYIPVYEYNGKVTNLIDLDGNVLQIDHEKNGPRVSGHSIEIYSNTGSFEVLVKLLEIFEVLDQIREDSPHTILCAHRGFNIIGTGIPTEYIYSISSIAIFSFEGDMDNHNFSETLSVPINFDSSIFNCERIDINFNDLDDRNDIKKQFEVAQIMYA